MDGLEKVPAQLDRMERLAAQLECTRSLQKIDQTLRDLRIRVSAARFSRKGEEGYLPPQDLENGRQFIVPEDENTARAEDPLKASMTWLR